LDIDNRPELWRIIAAAVIVDNTKRVIIATELFLIVVFILFVFVLIDNTKIRHKIEIPNFFLGSYPHLVHKLSTYLSNTQNWVKMKTTQN
jgi:hypothetical protein